MCIYKDVFTNIFVVALFTFENIETILNFQIWKSKWIMLYVPMIEYHAAAKISFYKIIVKNAKYLH